MLNSRLTLQVLSYKFVNPHNYFSQVHSLICYMLDEMQVAGWDVQTATDLSRCKDLSTFFLKRRTKAMTDRDDPVRGRRNVNSGDGKGA